MTSLTMVTTELIFPFCFNFPGLGLDPVNIPITGNGEKTGNKIIASFYSYEVF